MTKEQTYHSLAAILSYPEEGFEKRVCLCGNLLRTNYAEVSLAFDAFESFMTQASGTEREELFVATFDVQAVCCLDIGFVLFGEDYKRGRFLAHMKVTQEQAKNDCGFELADHLPNVLTLLTHLSWEDGRELVEHMVLSALARMIKSFGEGRNVYRDALIVIDSVLREDYDCRLTVVDLHPFKEHRDAALAEELGES